MRELHLHVGLPKTGTTYLQKCLLLNRERLAAQGFAMAPRQDANGGHHALAHLARAEGPEELAATLESAPGDRIIASSEVFSDILACPDEAAAFGQALRRRFDTTIYMMVRRQDFLKESAYAEMAKNKAKLPPLVARASSKYENPLLLYDNPDLDARATIIEDAFGREKVRIGIYREAARDDPFDRFCEMLGLKLNAVQRPAPSNESLSRRRTLFLAGMAKPDARLAQLAMRVVAGTRHLEDDGERFLMSPAERRAVVERYLEGNAALVARHALENGDWLLSFPEEDPSWSPATPIRKRERLMVTLALARTCLKNRGRSLPGRLRDMTLATTLSLQAAWETR